jgi:SNF2 family DNA or RNA helicase
MNQRLYGIWLGEVLFCFSGETSESKIDTWTAQVRKLTLNAGVRPFQNALLRLAEVRYPVKHARRNLVNNERKGLLGRTLEGLALSVEDTWNLLLHWDDNKVQAFGFECGAEFNYWSRALRFALKLLEQGQIVPMAYEANQIGGRRRGTQPVMSASFGPYFENQHDEELFRSLAVAMPPIGLAASHHLKIQDDSIEMMQMAVLHSFLSKMIDFKVRQSISRLGPKLKRSKADYRRGQSPIHELWWNHLLGTQALQFQGTIQEVEQLIQDTARVGKHILHKERAELKETEQLGTIRLCLRLEPYQIQADMPLEVVQSNPKWQLSFLAEGVEDPAVSIPAHVVWSLNDQHLSLRGRVYHHIQQNLLLRLGKAAKLAPELKALLSSPRPVGGILEAKEVFHFLSHSAALLHKNGVTLQMPSSWSKEGRKAASIKVKANHWAQTNTVKEKSLFGVEQLVSFEADVMLDGEAITVQELVELSLSRSPLVFFRGRWIEINLKEIKQVLKFIKRHEQQGTMSFRELMHLTALEDEARMLDGVYVEDIDSGKLLSQFIINKEQMEEAGWKVPSSLRGTLRPYQERGFQWLSVMRKFQFGALLADDMGLGKTIQVITVLLDNIKESKSCCLIVCPTSLIGNWERELERFAPQLKLYIHHGSDRLHGEEFTRKHQQYDIVLTTYQLVGRDAKEVQAVKWDTVVLDEAQYIKNYRTKQAQSVMKLQSNHRIAMTGTPVENRLSELWSIFQFLNPGYLGTHAFFKARYGSNDQPAQLTVLRTLIAPFLLRRLKSDPLIRKDLPEKIELKSYCTLTQEQVQQYEQVTSRLLSQIGDRTGIARKGLVLSSLTQLKQICNYPLQADNQTGKDTLERSGKLLRLAELLDLIMDNSEATLIFTQYVQMGQMLQEQLALRYSTTPFFLHGGVTKAERDKMVTQFQEGQGSPIFILSLKAGGVGLNLTRANHVIHYDRWWNPAVENQATDRVFRIGQRKNVEVHKLISLGTLEEKIDELIEAKRSLSEQVVGSGEQWITEMSNDELTKLITLQVGNLGGGM